MIACLHIPTNSFVRILDVIPGENGREPIASIEAIDGQTPFRTDPRPNAPCIATRFGQVPGSQLDAFVLIDDATQESTFIGYRLQVGSSQIMVGVTA